MDMNMSRIKPHENEIIGSHFLFKGKLVADDYCERVNQLISEHLEFVSKDESGWINLYRDPDDGRYWEIVYLQSELHGGGPASLRVVTKHRLKEVFDMTE